MPGPSRRTTLTALAGLAGAATGAGTGAVPTASHAADAIPSSRRPRPDRRPLVIGHRGASGYRPEHTLASYELAARLGADFVEPDLVSTRDGFLVCRHEPEIGGTTDVADHPEFAGRRRTVVLDGIEVDGWWTVDFTLAELRRLRAVERIPQVRQESTLYDGLFAVPTFDEVLALRRRLSAELGRPIGVYPETKHPTWHAQVGLPLEEPLLALLRRAGLNRSNAPVFVQSFEVSNLRRLRRLGLRAPQVQLLGSAGSPYDTVAAGAGPTYDEIASPAGLAAVTRYAQGIGPDKNRVVPRRPDGSLDAPGPLVGDAHAAGLLVHPYTFRAENAFLPTDLQVGEDPAAFGRALAEHAVFLEAGVDGVFSDQPDVSVVARDLVGRVVLAS